MKNSPPQKPLPANYVRPSLAEFKAAGFNPSNYNSYFEAHERELRKFSAAPVVPAIAEPPTRVKMSSDVVENPYARAPATPAIELEQADKDDDDGPESERDDNDGPESERAAIELEQAETTGQSPSGTTTTGQSPSGTTTTDQDDAAER